MQDLLFLMLSSLVDDTDAIVIESEVHPRTQAVTYHVRVAPEDMGKVVGKDGRIANAIRTVVKAAALKQKAKVYVDIRWARNGSEGISASTPL